MTTDQDHPGRKRFAFLLPDLAGGGAERVALRLISDCLAAGHEVDLVLKQAKGALLPLVPRQVRIVDLGAKRIRSVVMPFRAYLRERQPDAVHIMMWPLTIAGIVACKLARSNARIVVSEHCALTHQYRGSKATIAALALSTRTIFPIADVVLCVSAQSADDLAAISGIARDRIEVVYNPVAAPPSPVLVPPAIEEMWGKGEARILTVGSLKYQKNHAMLIRAFAVLARKKPARLVIVGEGPLRGELEQVAVSEGVADRVTMPGFTLDPWPYFASADVFALSSDYEGFGLVLVEAMFSGLPVVSTDCQSGPREILDGGRFGALTPVGDVAALADAIETALDHPVDPDVLRARADEMSGPQRSTQLLKLMTGEPA